MCLLATALLSSVCLMSCFAVGAQAQVAGPAYYLYSTSSGLQGPCSGSGTALNYVGQVNIANWRYRTVYLGSVGQEMYTVKYQDQGFNSAAKYGICRVGTGYRTYRYYGIRQIKRSVNQQWLCHDGGCRYITTIYGAWYQSGWI